MSQDKDEILAMARKAGAVFDPQWGIASNTGTATFERFATLCRAPLIAENEGLKESLESVLSQLKERDAELARVRAGEPFGWYSAKEDDFMLDKIRKTHERLNSHTHQIGKYDLALYTTPPQPAAQEPTSAVPVVEQLVVALDLAAPYFTHNNQVTAAIAAGRQYLKENGEMILTDAEQLRKELNELRERVARLEQVTYAPKLFGPAPGVVPPNLQPPFTITCASTKEKV